MQRSLDSLDGAKNGAETQRHEHEKEEDCEDGRQHPEVVNGLCERDEGQPRATHALCSTNKGTLRLLRTPKLRPDDEIFSEAQKNLSQ